MKIVLKAKNPTAFDRIINVLRSTLFLKENDRYIYKTNYGIYEIYSGGLLVFTGKRQSFGKAKWLKVKRVQRKFRKDILIVEVGNSKFEVEVKQFETSAPNKPFWATCSDKDYSALKRLLAK